MPACPSIAERLLILAQPRPRSSAARPSRPHALVPADPKKGAQESDRPRTSAPACLRAFTHARTCSFLSPCSYAPTLPKESPVPVQPTPARLRARCPQEDLLGMGNLAAIPPRGEHSESEHAFWQERVQLKRRAHFGLRIYQHNVRSMTGRGREVADLMREKKVDVMCVQETQCGCPEEEKGNFWRDMDGVMQELEEQERVIVGAELNVHVGSENEAIGRVHGGHGIGERIPEAESVVDFAVSFDMTIVNTFLMDGDKMREFKRRVLEDIDIGIEDVQEWWTQTAAIMRRHGKELLGETSGIIWEEKESWWWSEEIEKVVKDKEAKKRWEESQLGEDREGFREKNKVAKKVVAQAKAKTYDDVYNEPETKGGLNKMINLLKTRNTRTKDITYIKQMQDQDGVVLRKDEDVVKRWKEYFEQLLNEENYRLLREDGQVHFGMILERMIDARLREEVEIGKEQMEFMKGRGTTDGIFYPRQLMDKFREKQRDLHVVFIDLEKAFDRVPRQEVWRRVRERRVPEK
ncbi:uncharacterized protein [Palaemon carinicauda]|uniref:uncharacterized protein n=1 Tax=Palaemon carinicauda TaxID=392227 RepID=UPI0035B6548A